MTEVKNEFEKKDDVEETEEVASDALVDTDEIVEGNVEVEIVENETDLLIEELTTKLQEEENKRLRLLADYENFKRRVTLDKESMTKYRAQNIITNLIPVLDNFERALSVEATTEEAQSIITGMEMVYRTLLEALKSEGLVEIEALDKEFDPNYHQAIMTDSNPEKTSGTVLEDLQKGYLLKDRVLRPSMVKVNE